VIIAPARPRRAARSSSLIRLDVVQVDHRDALRRAGSVRQNSASQSLYARKMADIRFVSATLK